MNDREKFAVLKNTQALRTLHYIRLGFSPQDLLYMKVATQFLPALVSAGALKQNEDGYTITKTGLSALNANEDRKKAVSREPVLWKPLVSPRHPRQDDIDKFRAIPSLVTGEKK